MENLKNLNDQQYKAATHYTGPLLILAGAGSGKTKVLTHRIAYLIDEKHVAPWSIMALTFTNKAAGEMRSRVNAQVGAASSDIQVSTFHSACVRILRRYCEVLGYTRSFTIYDSDDQKSLMRQIIKYLNLDPKKFKERDFLSAISHAKDELISPIQYEMNANGDFMKQNYARAYREYEKRLKEANAFDFDDLICKSIELFENNPDVLEVYQRRYRFIMVDEYQDTNTAQFRLIKLMADHIRHDGTHEQNLCVVGDDDQSIYKFRGANITNILNFEKYYPDAKVIKLEENYRSTANILEAANSVIHNNIERKSKALWTKKDKGNTITLKVFNTDYDEADGVSESIFNAKYNGYADYNEFAILYRTNAQSRVFEEKLVRANIPYKIVGGLNFYQRREIKDVLAYLRAIENENDSVSLMRIINVPKRGIGLSTLDRVSSFAIDHGISFYAALKSYEFIDGIGRSKSKIESFVALMESFKNHLNSPDYTLSDLFDEVLNESGYISMLDEEDDLKKEERLENIDELRTKIADYINNFDINEAADNSTDKMSSTEASSDTDNEYTNDANITGSIDSTPTLRGFLEEISLVADIDNVSDDNNLVLLMTLHSAKGLEFPYVFIVGMEDNVFPGYMAINAPDPEIHQKELEEERRLCYVGITRAKKRLALSCVKCRFKNGEQQFNRPSMFLKEIPRYLLNHTKGMLMNFDDNAEEKVNNESFSSKSSGKNYYSDDSDFNKSNNYDSDYNDSDYSSDSDFNFTPASKSSLSGNHGSNGMSGYDFLSSYSTSKSGRSSGYSGNNDSWNPEAEKKAKLNQYMAGNKDVFAGNPYISKGFKKKTSTYDDNPYISSNSKAGKTTVSESAAAVDSLKSGDRVKHKMFGTGTITEITPKGSDFMVNIEFDKGMNRKMLASFAKLEKAD